MVLEGNINEDYDFSAMAKSQRGSGRERKGFLTFFLTMDVFEINQLISQRQITLKHHPDKIRLSTRNIFLLCVFYN